jgi:CBS domain-containing protein
MEAMMKIISRLIQNQRIIHIESTATVLEAAQKLQSYQIGAVLVMDNDALVGILSERDVCNRLVAQGKSPATTLVKDIMTPSPDTITPDQSAENALAMMAANRYRHLPIVDDSGVVLGMVSIRDLYAAIKVQLQHEVEQRDAMISGTSYGIA